MATWFSHRLRAMFQLDGWIFLSMAVLLFLGIAAIYSVDLSRDPSFATLKKHLLIVIIGFVIFFVVAAFDHTALRATALLWYGVSVALLILVLIFGETIRGTRGWFRVGAFSFQPAEFAKLGVILLLAYFFSRRFRYFKESATFVGSLLFTALLAVLILVQPDFGTAFLIGLAWVGVMLMVGTRLRYWIIFLMLVSVVAVGGWRFVLKDYQRERFLTFIDASRDPLGAGYNVTQSIIAIGAGGWLGRGLGFGSQSQLRFLPEAHSDFIFAVIGEELGFVGVAAVLAAFGVILVRILVLLPRAPDDFSGVFLAGVAALLVAQVVVNVGGTLGLVPITGVPLPLVSQGGSSLVITMVMLGMVESIYRGAARRRGILTLEEGGRGVVLDG